MEFWGAEVKSGEPLKVEPGEGIVLHLSQACLGEGQKEKGHESVCLFVNIDNQKFVLGTLSSEKFPQLSFDLVFEKTFELSHNWKNGSVHFCGYKAVNPVESDGTSDSESDLGDDLPLNAVENGKPETQIKQAKPDVGKANIGKANKQVKIVEPNKDVKADEKDEQSDGDEDDSDEDMLNDEESDEEEDDDDDDEDESSEEDEETPKKAESIKKRPAGSAGKTPVPDKKTKLTTPQKTDGKKVSGHVATPFPTKQAGKALAKNDNSKQTPKSSGTFECKSCKRSFGSEVALSSHTKAKHGAAK